MDKQDEKKAFKEGLKLSPTEREAFLKKEEEIINDSEKYELYMDYVSQQKESFKAIMHYFNDMLNEYKEKGKISDLFEFRARIKSPESAIANDEIKALNDVFGLEFLGATDDEVEFILREFSKKAHDTRQTPKNHNKSNGYKAMHRSFELNEETAKEISEKFGVKAKYFPLFECQFKTIAVALEASKGKAAHSDYKMENPKEIQKQYNSGKFIMGYNIPQMWVSKNNQMVKLSSEETLKKLYPFLDMTKKKEEK